MLIVSLLDLYIERITPVLEIIRICGDIIDIIAEPLIAVSLHILFVRYNDIIVKEIVLFFGLFLQYHLLLVSYKFIVVHFLLLEVNRVETFNGTHLLDCAYLTHLVDKLEPPLISHSQNDCKLLLT